MTAAAAAANNTHDPLADLITPKPSEGPIPRQDSSERLQANRASAAAAADGSLVTPRPSEVPIPREDSADRLRVTRAMSKATATLDGKQGSVERVDSEDMPPKKKGRYILREVPAPGGAFN
jgi:hypothetical protein